MSARNNEYGNDGRNDGRNGGRSGGSSDSRNDGSSDSRYDGRNGGKSDGRNSSRNGGRNANKRGIIGGAKGKARAGEAKRRVMNVDFAVAAVVLILLEAVLLFNFMIMPLKRHSDETEGVLKNYLALSNRMESNIVNAAERERELADLAREISEAERELPPVILNEDISLTIGEYAEKHNITLEAVVFAGLAVVSPERYLNSDSAAAAAAGAGADVGVGADGGAGTGTGIAIGTATGAGTTTGTGAGTVIGLGAGANAGTGTGSNADSGAGAGASPSLGASANYPYPDIAAGVIGAPQGAGANGAMGVSSGKLLSIQDVQVNFSSEFHTAGQFIKEFEDSVQRVRVKSVALTRLKEGVLKGVLNLEYIALTVDAEAGAPDRAAPDIEGKGSIFQSYSGYIEEDADMTVILQPGDIDVEPNFYMVLNQSVVNDAKIRFGVYPHPETELFYNVNSAVKASLTISGDENELSYTYVLGTSSRTERRRHDVNDGAILISIISGPRANEDDKVAVLLDVENNTGLPLEIMVRNEDVLNPRFNLGEVSGSVTVLN